WSRGGLDVVLSRYILDELARVLPRSLRVSSRADEIRDLVDGFMFLAEIVEPAGTLDDQLRGQADQSVLRTLLAGHANYLITGDQDLLALARHYPIVTPAEFRMRH